MICICSFCDFFGEVPRIALLTACPVCNMPTLRRATEWEIFMGRKLTLAEEIEARNRVAAILKTERH